MHVHLAAPMALSRAGWYWRGSISFVEHRYGRSISEIDLNNGLVR
jgi:hypothetical protein